MKSWFTLPVLMTAISVLSTSAWGQTTSKDAEWQFRVRAVQSDFSNKSNPFNLAAVNNFAFGRDAIGIKNKSAAAIDVTRFLGGGLAFELGYSLPTKRSYTAVGGGSGTVEMSQTTAMLQYHFKSFKSGLSSYVGAGYGSINSTSQNFRLLNTTRTNVGSANGLALQLGLDYKLSESVYLNLDYKYLQAKANLSQASNGTPLTSLKLDPSVYGIGIGFRF